MPLEWLNPAFLLDVIDELLLLGLALVVGEASQRPRVGSGHRLDREPLVCLHVDVVVALVGGRRSGRCGRQHARQACESRIHL